jgi:pyrimidine deaminase RibD-like protein
VLISGRELLAPRAVRFVLETTVSVAASVSIFCSSVSGTSSALPRVRRLHIDEARKSVPENDGRPHPWVGAVVVKDGKVLGTAHRGEVPGNHAEFVALERNLADVAVAEATVYTTLEPCTTRNPPKIPCVDGLIERRVARVVIGILDPDERIRGKGQRKLSNAGIETSLFPHDLAMEVEELNREFTRFCEQQTLNVSLSAKTPTADEDQSSWPDVILECQWPSLVHESRIPGSHIVRRRPWMLRYRGPGSVYNGCVHRIDFGEYEALFPRRVPTLTDTASVHPIICHKSDGLVITAHDLESLIHNPPSGCDVHQYAVETEGNEDQEVPLKAFVLEVEIPVTISYEDKNGNQFKIRYLLHYDTYMEKGEMIRIGRIEKIAPI